MCVSGVLAEIASFRMRAGRGTESAQHTFGLANTSLAIRFQVASFGLLNMLIFGDSQLVRSERRCSVSPTYD